MNRDPRKPYKPPCPEGARLIPLSQGQWAIVDEDKYKWLMGWKWCAQWSTRTQSYYAVRNGTVDEYKGKHRKLILMHRCVLGIDGSTQGDHIHHQTLDNRISQLSVVTSRQNGRNLKRAGLSKYSNVTRYGKLKNGWYSFGYIPPLFIWARLTTKMKLE